MKTEQGIVVEVIDNVAKIRVGRHNDCKNCGACPGSDSVIISATNKLGAKPGQRVAFQMKEVNVLRAAFVVFILPLLAIFIGALLGGVIGGYIGLNIHVFQAIGGIFTFLLSLVFIKLFDRATTKSQKTQPVIISIL